MKVDINLGDATLWAVCCLCVAMIVCLITVAVWKYNENAVRINYEEVAEKGTQIVYWRKVK